MLQGWKPIQYFDLTQMEYQDFNFSLQNFLNYLKCVIKKTETKRANFPQRLLKDAMQILEEQRNNKTDLHLRALKMYMDSILVLEGRKKESKRGKQLCGERQ